MNCCETSPPGALADEMQMRLFPSYNLKGNYSIYYCLVVLPDLVKVAEQYQPFSAVNVPYRSYPHEQGALWNSVQDRLMGSKGVKGTPKIPCRP
jgi:hypothetical protein